MDEENFSLKLMESIIEEPISEISQASFLFSIIKKKEWREGGEGKKRGESERMEQQGGKESTNNGIIRGDEGKTYLRTHCKDKRRRRRRSQQ